MAAGPAPLAVSVGDQSPHDEREWMPLSSAYWGLIVIILATFMTFFDQQVFSNLGKVIKAHFELSDAWLGFIAGPATIICYVFVGFPLARLADIFGRKHVLAGSAAILGTIISLGGVAQNLTQFIVSRVFLAAGGSAHAPASYSMMADAFPPKRLPLAFAILQFGFIGGNSIGGWAGGSFADMSASWAPTLAGPLTIQGWQWILIGLGLPSMLIGLLFLTVREPQRQASAGEGLQPPMDAPLGRQILIFMGWDAFKAINAKPKVYYPLFFALALSALETFGLLYWRPQMINRTYGWSFTQIGDFSFWPNLIASLLGLVLGAALVSWLSRFRKDANVVAATICFSGVTICSIIAPLMSSAEATIGVFSIAVMFGLAGAVPQNAAVQRVAPNSMRGQVTAMYLFMFTFFGAIGIWFIGLIQTYIVGDESQLWKGLLLAAILLLPAATFLMYRAIRPYREEVIRLESLGL
jgi:MFS family permease